MKARSAKYVCLALAAAILGSFAISAGAEVVRVMPDSMNGWVIASQKGSGSSDPIADLNLVGPGAAPLGPGSFHMKTYYSDSDPLQKIYLGTNEFSGVTLNNIVTFKYSTFLAYRDYGTSGNPLGQPPMIEIMTDSGSNGNQMRRFVFKPYGYYGGHNVALNTWQEWDLLTGDGVNTGRWEMLNNSSADYFGNWNWLKARYPGEMKLRTPYEGDYSSGYDAEWRLANLSATSLSVKIGAGKAHDTKFGGTGGWWRESSSIDGYVDKITIGVRQEDGSIEEIIYNFDAGDAIPRAITNKSAKDTIMNNAKKYNLFKVFGRIVCDPKNPGSDVNNDSDYLWLDDGSGPIKVHVQAHDYVTEGDYASAVGTIDNTTTPATVESSKANFEILYNAFF